MRKVLPGFVGLGHLIEKPPSMREGRTLLHIQTTALQHVMASSVIRVHRILSSEESYATKKERHHTCFGYKLKTRAWPGLRV